VNALLEEEGKYLHKIAGVVDPYPDNCPQLNEIIKRDIPIFQTLDQFYAVSHADLAIISSPIQFHASQTCLALVHGSNVLCEKPSCCYDTGRIANDQGARSSEQVCEYRLSIEFQ
jgi:predicted dehydrogenase